MDKSELGLAMAAMEMLINHINSNNLNPEEKEKIPEEMEICYSGKISLAWHYVEFGIRDKKDGTLKSKGRVYRNGNIKIN